jgi:hypothetical protein
VLSCAADSKGEIEREHIVKERTTSAHNMRAHRTRAACWLTDARAAASANCFMPRRLTKQRSSSLAHASVEAAAWIENGEERRYYCVLTTKNLILSILVEALICKMKKCKVVRATN